MMTREQLALLKEAERQATQGIWDTAGKQVVSKANLGYRYGNGLCNCLGSGSRTSKADKEALINAYFIALMRNNIKDLIEIAEKALNN